MQMLQDAIKRLMQNPPVLINATAPEAYMFEFSVTSFGPKSYHRFFHGPIDKKTGESKLKSFGCTLGAQFWLIISARMQDGSFLVRYSSDGKGLTLSVLFVLDF